jgi:hypothetical protein
MKQINSILQVSEQVCQLHKDRIFFPFRMTIAAINTLPTVYRVQLRSVALQPFHDAHDTG